MLLNLFCPTAMAVARGIPSLFSVQIFKEFVQGREMVSPACLSGTG